MSGPQWTTTGCTMQQKEIAKKLQNLGQELYDMYEAGELSHVQMLKIWNVGTLEMQLLLEELRDERNSAQDEAGQAVSG